MGANSTQGWASLLLLVAFTCLSGSMFAGGSFVLLAIFAASLVGSVSLFVKARPWEHAQG